MILCTMASDQSDARRLAARALDLHSRRGRSGLLVLHAPSLGPQQWNQLAAARFVYTCKPAWARTAILALQEGNEHKSAAM